MKKTTAILSLIIALVILIIPISETSVFAIHSSSSTGGGSTTSFNPIIKVVNHNNLIVSFPNNSGQYGLAPSGDFFASHISANPLVYYPSSTGLTECEAKTNITLTDANPSLRTGSFPSGNWVYNYYNQVYKNGEYTCQEVQKNNIKPIDFTNQSNFDTVFQFISNSQIDATDSTNSSQKYVFTENSSSSSKGSLVYDYNYNGCVSTITVHTIAYNQGGTLRDGNPTSNSSNIANNNNVPINSGTLRVETPVSTNVVGSQRTLNQPFDWATPFPTTAIVTNAQLPDPNITCYPSKNDPDPSYKLPINLEDPTINGQLAININGTGVAGSTMTNSSSNNSSTSTGISCGFSLNPLNDVFCALIKFGISAVKGINNIIYSQLNLGTCNSGGNASVVPNKIFNTCSNSSSTPNPYHSAWNEFRNIALALLVIMTLIIIIAQAIKG